MADRRDSDFALDAGRIKQRLTERAEIAFLDIREQGQYVEGHPFLAVPLAYSRLERDVAPLVPRRATPLVLLDNDDGLAERAARRLRGLGYERLHKVAGGAAGWAAAGFTLFQGVNVPSKTFGELVEQAFATPHVTAEELRRKRLAGEALLHLDGRPLEEFQRMTVPGALCCPNAEIGHRLAALTREPALPIVVSCAGRTRSIIGAQSLIALGVPNPVYALENGTQGWQLAGLELEHGAARSYPAALSAAQLAESRRRAADAIRRYRLPLVDAATFEVWAQDPERTLYCFDVRDAADYATGHHPAARHAPGGQLVQATDHWVAVRGARCLLFDDTGLRAATTALWLRAMGHEVYIFDPAIGTASWTTTVPMPPQGGTPALPRAAAGEIDSLLAAGGALIDLRASQSFRRRHILGARWSIRPRLVPQNFPTLGIETSKPLVLTAQAHELAPLAAVDLREGGCRDIRFLPADEAAWLAAGLTLTEGLEPADAEAIDRVFFVHDRHEGNRAAMRAYLDWEVGLIGQLDAQERAVFDLDLARPR